MLRCPVCNGLRTVHPRHANRQSKVCHECREGRITPKSQYHNYWTQRFTMDEIRDLARAIWG